MIQRVHNGNDDKYDSASTSQNPGDGRMRTTGAKYSATMLSL
jgi:hypothetical protein